MGTTTSTGALRALTIPATLQDSLDGTSGSLSDCQRCRPTGARSLVVNLHMILLSTVSQLDEAILQRELGRLVEAEIVYQRGVPPQATYIFKHALIQDAAYESLLKSTRQRYHQRIAQVLEAHFPETAEAQPELCRHHYTEAGLTEKAVHYWYKLGKVSSSVQPTWKPSATFVKGSHCSRRCRRPLSVPNAK